MNPKIEEHLKAVECARRDTHYPIMDEKAEELLALLKDDESSAAWAVRSKVSYELQMGTFQQAEASLNKAKMLAEQAIEEADKAGDTTGSLYAQMTLAGHILPALRKGRKAREELASVYEDAVELLAKTTDEHEKNRSQRVIMNCYWHSILLAIEYDGDPDDVRRWTVRLEANPVFQQYKDTEEGKKILADADAFVDGKTSTV